MTTTDEMKEKLEKENEALQTTIKAMEIEVEPLKKQIELNNRVLSVINNQKIVNPLKRKYGRKKASAKADKVQDNNKEQEA